jgi:flagellar basal body rod protein FlgF
MDRAAYVAMTGASHILLAQGLAGHNLANSSTPGFRGDLYAFASSPIYGPGFPSRVNGVVRDSGWDASGGGMESTGRELDVAVQGTGFIAIQGPDEKRPTRAPATCASVPRACSRRARADRYWAPTGRSRCRRTRSS